MRRIISLLVVLFTLQTVSGQDKAKEAMINFEDHIKPIFREHCTACHSESDKESDLALDTYGATLAGGSSGEVIVEGNASASRLFALVSHAERPFMPPDEDAIDKAKIDLLRTWIEQGMPENSGSKIKRSTAAAAAMLSNVSSGKPEGPPPLPETALSQPVMLTERSAAISALAASPWAPLVAVGGQKQVVLYHAETSELLAVIPFPEGEPQSLTFTRDGKQLLIGGGRHSHSGCAVLVDIATGERITKVGDELDIVLAADISPDKSRIAIAGPQKIVRIFDSLTGEKLLDLKKHTDWIYSLRYSPDGILLASGDRSNGLILWEADTGNLYSQYNSHKGAVRSLDFRPDSNVLASGSLDGTIKLWDLFENKEIRSWNAHGGGVTSIAYCNDGLVASAGRDARIKLWNADASLKQQFTGLSESALEVAITGDAARIAGGDWNGKVQLWNVADPKQTTILLSNPESLGQRLAKAMETFQAMEGKFSQSNQQVEELKKQVNASGQRKAAAEASLMASRSKLSGYGKESERLVQESKSNDQEIERLKALLLTAQQRSTALADALAKNGQAVQAEQAKVSQAELLIKDANAAQETASKLLGEAEVGLASVSKQFDLAKQGLKKLEAAKKRFDARAVELTQIAAAHSSKLAELQSQLEKAENERASGTGELEQADQQVTALQAQLAELQAKLSRAEASKSAAQSRVDAAESSATSLKQNIESEEAANLEAASKLKLFEESYKKMPAKDS